MVATEIMRKIIEDENKIKKPTHQVTNSAGTSASNQTDNHHIDDFLSDDVAELAKKLRQEEPPELQDAESSEEDTSKKSGKAKGDYIRYYNNFFNIY